VCRYASAQASLRVSSSRTIRQPFGGDQAFESREPIADQVFHQRRQAIVLALQPVVLDRHIPAFDVAGLTKPLAERGHRPRTIPIVFGVSDLVTNLARPGGNATGVNFFNLEVVAKRLGLLHELVPQAVRVAALVNPANVPAAEITLRDVQNAAHVIGLQIYALNASTGPQVDAAFAALQRERPDALFVAPDGFFSSRRAQFVTMTARERIPAAYPNREFVADGGLMSYGADQVDMWRQVGVYTGNILKGVKPADLPVVQSTKFELVINLKTAKALGITIPETLLATADEVIQ
jgi:putative tryptophan/tyrosine transport system substrate-binding protein